MKKIVPLAVVASLSLMACREERPAPELPPPSGGTCNASGAQTVVGRALTDRSIAAARRLSGASAVRILRPGQMVTMEYRADRVNLDIDRGRTIVGIRCG